MNTKNTTSETVGKGNSTNEEENGIGKLLLDSEENKSSRNSNTKINNVFGNKSIDSNVSNLKSKDVGSEGNAGSERDNKTMVISTSSVN